MATNRYTNITPSQFNPLSLQEIMLVPTLKRQQHDAALAGMEQLRDLQVDPLKVHEERALQIKSDFENKINEKVEQLNSQGYNPSIVSELSRLNKEYKDLISPTGEIGKINQAKQIRNQMYDQWLKNKDYDKYGSDVMQRHWQDFEGAYTGFDSEGNITNIGAMSSPAYEDLDEDLKTRFKGLGHIATDMLSGGVDFQEEADGSLSVYNTKTGSKTKINDPQIKAMIEDFRLKWVDPRGSGYKSLVFAGVDPNYALQRAGNVAGANIIRESGSTNITTGSRTGYENTQKDKIKGVVPMLVQGTTNPFEKFGMNAKQGLAEYNRLSDGAEKGTLSPEEGLRYEEMRGAFEMYEKMYENDPELRERYEDLEKQLISKEHLLPQGVTPDKIQDLNEYWEANKDENGHLVDVNKAGQTITYRDLAAWKQSKHQGGKDPIVIDGRFVYSGNEFDAVQKYRKETSAIRKEKEKIEEDTWKNTSIQNNYYTQMGFTPKDTTLIKNIEGETAKTIASTPGGWQNLANTGTVTIHTIDNEGKNKKKLNIADIPYKPNVEYVNTIYSDNNTPVFIYKEKNSDGTYTTYEVAQQTNQLRDRTGNLTPYGFIIEGMKTNGSVELGETLENNTTDSRVRAALYSTNSDNNPKTWSMINSNLSNYFGNDVAAAKAFRDKYDKNRRESLITLLQNEGEEKLIEKSYYYQHYQGNYPKGFDNDKKLTEEDKELLKEYQSIANDLIDNNIVDPYNDFR